MPEKIRRQHETTQVSELHGRCCSSLLAVRSTEDQEYACFYLKVSEVWHRFYLNAGLLFWQEGIAPDSEDDLFGGYEYMDLGKSLQVEEESIIQIEMADCRLFLQFGNGAALKLENRVQDDFTRIIP